MNPSYPQFQQIITNRFQFAFFKLLKLPAAFFAGLRIRTLTESEAVVVVKHSWLNQNPFKSMYFAVQAMAAEMSTGLFAVGQTYKRNPPVSTLVTGIEAKFYKKATGIIAFKCTDGLSVAETIDACIADGEARTLICKSTGLNQQGEMVAEFFITWSFKSKRI